MSASPTKTLQPDQLFTDVLAAYRAAKDAGEAPSLTKLLEQNPELADQLRTALDGASAQTLRPHATAGVSTPSPTAAEAPTRDAANAPSGCAAIPSPGDFGDYELLEEVARGGMGVVFKARQKSLSRIVALKMILAGQWASKEQIKRFRTEAEQAGQLDHPNIVPIYQVGDVSGQQFFTMKLIEGGNLLEHRERLRSDPKGAARLLATIARAVHHAHQRGILHRDLKPGNILIDTDGEPHITDFGLAKHLEGHASTMSGAIVGTPSYMSPEQAAARKNLTTAADVYSLGAVLYELLAGQPPFRMTNAFDTLMQVLERDPDPAPYSQSTRGPGRSASSVSIRSRRAVTVVPYAWRKTWNVI